MESLKRMALLALGIILIGGCASPSSGGSSTGAGSSATTDNPDASFHYPNY
jgi:PBP1b-binding outer membrane lipoprotein LpoB